MSSPLAEVNTTAFTWNKVIGKDKTLGDTIRNTKGYSWQVVGGRLLRDRINDRIVHKIELSIAHNMAISGRKRLAFALGTSFNNFSFSADDFQPYAGIYNDPLIDPTMGGYYNDGNNWVFNFFDLSIGAWLYSDKNYWGWSSENVVPASGSLSNSQPGSYQPSTVLHHFTYGHYFYIDENSKLDFVVNAMKTQVLPPAIETMLLYHHEVFFAGAGVRLLNNILLSAGLTIKSRMLVSLAYEIPIGASPQIFGSTA